MDVFTEFALMLAVAWSRARWIPNSVHDLRTNESLLASLREHGFRGRMAAVAYSEMDAQALEQHGVDLVIRPHHAAAQEAAQSLVEAG